MFATGASHPSQKMKCRVASLVFAGLMATSVLAQDSSSYLRSAAMAPTAVEGEVRPFSLSSSNHHRSSDFTRAFPTSVLQDSAKEVQEVVVDPLSGDMEENDKSESGLQATLAPRPYSLTCLILPIILLLLLSLSDNTMFGMMAVIDYLKKKAQGAAQTVQNAGNTVVAAVKDPKTAVNNAVGNVQNGATAAGMGLAQAPGQVIQGESHSPP